MRGGRKPNNQAEAAQAKVQTCAEICEVADASVAEASLPCARHQEGPNLSAIDVPNSFSIDT